MSLNLKRKEFSRFKYAEEFCQELTSRRIQWQMTSRLDQSHIDVDGETYTYDDFVIDWFEPTTPLDL